MIFLLLEAVARVESNRLEVALERTLFLEVLRSETGDLVIEELRCVENCLLFLARHLLEHKGVVWVLDQVDTAIGVFVLAHVGEHEPLLLLGADPG